MRMNPCRVLSILAVMLAVMLPAASSIDGPGREPTVGIGLFLSGGEQISGSRAEAARAASMAVKIANEAGGIGGVTIRLVESDEDSGWAGATRGIVRLLYEENVVAVVGGLGSRTAHVVAQVIARARGRAVFVTPWATDETLTRIRLPWLFSVVPDDRAQALALTEEIFKSRGIRSVVAWVGPESGWQEAARIFVQAAPSGSVRLLAAGNSRSLIDLEGALSGGQTGALLIFAAEEESVQLVRWLGREGLRLPIFAPLARATPGMERALKAEGLEALFATPSPVVTPGGDRCACAFEEAFGQKPSALARYTCDAVAVLVDALRRSEPAKKISLADALFESRLMGATGEIRFNEHRGREGIPRVSLLVGDRRATRNFGSAARDGDDNRCR
jgi:branched-chain amino acid transport system substrate-binding protein